MTQDEIIEMARQAGFSLGHNVTEEYANKLQAFAKLVAAKEREKLKNVALFDRWYQELDIAVLSEREACAKIAWNFEPDENGPIETAIRARGEA